MAQAVIDPYNAPQSWNDQRDSLTEFTLSQLKTLVQDTKDEKIKLEALKSLSATLALGASAKGATPTTAIQKNTFNLAGKDLPKSLQDRLGIAAVKAHEEALVVARGEDPSEDTSITSLIGDDEDD
jgi:hypothetical protein